MCKHEHIHDASYIILLKRNNLRKSDALLCFITNKNLNNKTFFLLIKRFAKTCRNKLCFLKYKSNTKRSMWARLSWNVIFLVNKMSLSNKSEIAAIILFPQKKVWHPSYFKESENKLIDEGCSHANSEGCLGVWVHPLHETFLLISFRITL